MAANEVVGIDIVARLDDFRAELAKIPDIGAKEAKALTSQLSREIKRAERASKTAAEQSKKTAEALKKQAAATKEVAAATKETTSTIKNLGAVVVSIELLKQAFELAKRVIGDTLERAQRLDEELGGDLTASINEASKALSDMKDAAVQPLIPSIQSLANGIADIAGGARIAMEAIFGLTNAQAELQAQTALENEAIDKQDRRVMDAETAVRNLTERLQQYKETGEATTDGIRAYEQAIAEANDELERQRGILLRLDGEFDTDREKRQQAARERIKQAQDAKREAENSIAVASRSAQAAKSQSKEVVEATKEIVEAEGTKQEAIRRSLEVREKTAAVENSIVGQLATTAISAAENVAGSVINALEETARANIKEAQRRREVEIGLAILRGELQAAGAFGTTLVTYGATPQGFALAAAAAALIGVSSKAAAAAGAAASAERFHSGGVVARDERAAIVQPGEGFLTRQGVNAAGGERALRDLNAGDGGGGGPMVLQVGHKAFDAMASRALSSSSSPLSQRLSAMSGPVGGHNPHRAN